MNTYRGIRLIAFRPLGVIVGVVGFVSMGATHAMAADYAVANDTNQAIVFDASTLATVATIPLTGTELWRDCHAEPIVGVCGEEQ